MAGPIGSDRPLGLECVEDSTTIVVEVTDELPRLRHRVRLGKVSNATKLPADLGLHPASRTASIERAAPSHLNYFSEQKYCLPGLPVLFIGAFRTPVPTSAARSSVPSTNRPRSAPPRMNLK